jgi:hypothetical protein
MLYDYYEFPSTSVAETQVEFCRTFKECDPRRLLKVFYGYLFELQCNFRNNGAQNYRGWRASTTCTWCSRAGWGSVTSSGCGS